MPPGSRSSEGSLGYGASNLKEDGVKAQILLVIACPHAPFLLKWYLGVKAMTTLSRPSVTLEIPWSIWV